MVVNDNCKELYVKKVFYIVSVLIAKIQNHLNIQKLEINYGLALIR